MYDDILVPTDGSEYADRAARYARILARASGATVHVVSAVETDELGSTAGGDVFSELKTRVQRDRQNAVESIATKFDYGDVVTDLVTGKPHEAILDYAADHDVDLVVMGTHGRTGLDRLVVGSTTERVVRLSSVPVLTVGPDADSTPKFENVLVPTDGSEGVAPAVTQALDFAEAFDATVHAVNVVDAGRFVSEGSSHSAVPQDTLDVLEEQGRTATEQIADRADRRGCDAVTEVLQGSPADSILDYADDNDVNLVVMGTHARTGLDRLVIGSVTENVLRRADCPVLTVRHSDADD